MHQNHLVKPRKKVLVVSAPSSAGEETFAGFLNHCHGDQIEVTEADSFEKAATLLFPGFDQETAHKEMSEIELPSGARFEMTTTRFGHHIHVFGEDGHKLDYRDEKHFAVGLAVESIEKRNRVAPFHCVITEETIPLKSVPRSPQTYLGLSLISLAQMVAVPRIGILVPKGGQDVRHFMGDIRCGEKRLVLSFKHSEWKHVSRELIGV